MQRIDYNKKFIETLLQIGEKKPKLLLHSCCAPCSSSVIERLQGKFNLTIFYYNPNIFPQEEYEKRKNEQICYLKKQKIPFVVPKYEHQSFLNYVKGKENLGEKSERCKSCYIERLNETAKYAKENDFDFFAQLFRSVLIKMQIG